jgi:3-hydroxybutyryl-CoA dehydrogenase
MQGVVLADNEQWTTFIANNTDCEWTRATTPFSFATYPQADFFLLLQQGDVATYGTTIIPVFINEVCNTAAAKNYSPGMIRINGWPGFLQRSTWEVAGNITEVHKQVLEKLNKKISVTADEPGFVSARIIAMIINEAYFALGDDVSTKVAIDTAMKLGTNYPYGPFERAAQIGVHNIYTLLLQLQQTDKRYTPAPLLVKEATAT